MNSSKVSSWFSERRRALVVKLLEEDAARMLGTTRPARAASDWRATTTLERKKVPVEPRAAIRRREEDIWVSLEKERRCN